MSTPRFHNDSPSVLAAERRRQAPPATRHNLEDEEASSSDPDDVTSAGPERYSKQVQNDLVAYMVKRRKRVVEIEEEERRRVEVSIGVYTCHILCSCKNDPATEC